MFSSSVSASHNTHIHAESIKTNTVKQDSDRAANADPSTSTNAKISEGKIPNVQQKQKRAAIPESSISSANPAKTSAKPPAKGVSLANPNKRARKYKPIEFASDDDE